MTYQRNFQFANGKVHTLQYKSGEMQKLLTLTSEEAQRKYFPKKTDVHDSTGTLVEVIYENPLVHVWDEPKK